MRTAMYFGYDVGANDKIDLGDTAALAKQVQNGAMVGLYISAS